MSPHSLFEEQLTSKGFKAVAGIDEAGRGPLAGPVVAASCILPPDTLFDALNDSKKLTPKQREILFQKLTTNPGVIFGIGKASAKEIDKINILQATFLAMQRAVDAMEHLPDYLLIDGNRSPLFSIPRETIIGGDGISLSIAAASILAKVTRDRIMIEMDEKWPEYGFKKHKGYGTKIHMEALKKWGPCPEHRMGFSPVRERFTSHLQN